MFHSYAHSQNKHKFCVMSVTELYNGCNHIIHLVSDLRVLC